MTVAEEEKLQNKIRDVYNSGDCKRAVDLSCSFLKRYPDSYRAKYSYAVMHGDYSWFPGHSPEEKQRLLSIAKNGISELFHDAAFKNWPRKFQQSVRNEYYWLFELHEEQYKLGLERLEAGENGHYSACVGASMLAYKLLKEGDLQKAEEWAQKSLFHFSEFEKLVPDWYNINYFAAQAKACIGQYPEAMACFKDMYRKQKALEKADELADFQRKLEEISKLRAD